MGTRILRSIGKGKIAIIVILLMLMPLRSMGSYNTFFREYNFKFPHNDVMYSPGVFSNASPKNISLPSMDIQGASVRLNTLNFLKIKMMFGGNLYTNYTTIYQFYAKYYFNSTTSVEIFIGNSINYTISGYTSINQTKVSIYLSKVIKSSTVLSFSKQFNYDISPTIKGDTISWLVNMVDVDNYLPLSQIFFGTYFSNQTNVNYQSNFQFRFKVENYLYGGRYNVFIQNEYTINHIGNIHHPFTVYLYPIIWAIGIISISAFLYYRNRRKQRNNTE